MNKVNPAPKSFSIIHRNGKTYLRRGNFPEIRVEGEVYVPKIPKNAFKNLHSFSFEG